MFAGPLGLSCEVALGEGGYGGREGGYVGNLDILFGLDPNFNRCLKS